MSVNPQSEFIYRATVLVCDGTSMWEMPGLTSNAIQRCIKGEMHENDWDGDSWKFVSPQGCKSCELCLKQLSSPLPGCYKCHRCHTNVGSFQHQMRKGFCNVCDLDHYRMWARGLTDMTFIEYRSFLSEKYIARNAKDGSAKEVKDTQKGWHVGWPEEETIVHGNPAESWVLR